MDYIKVKNMQKLLVKGGVKMKQGNGRANIGNPMQKGKRRQKLHEQQDNHGSPQKQPSVFQNNKDNKFE